MEIESTRKKIVYLISHGHTARGVLQTGLLKKIVNQNIEVVVIAKTGTEKTLKNCVEAEGARIDYFKPRSGKWDAQRTILRSYVHQNIRENPALWEKHQRRVQDKSASFKRRVLNRFYFILGTGLRHITPLKRLYYKIEKRLYFNPDAIDVLRHHAPDVIISTRPVDTMEAELLNAATRLGIHKIMYILSWDNITSKGIFPELADSYLTWGEIMNQELRDYYGVKNHQLFITGVTHFDIHAEVKLKSVENRWVDNLKLDSTKPYLFFTMSASYFAPNEIDIIEWLSDQVHKNSFGMAMQLVVRPHMQNLDPAFSESSWIQRLKNLNSDRVVVDWPDVNSDQLAWFMSHDEMIKLSYLLKGATICLNSGSTISIEACIFDKPTILTMIDVVEKSEWESVKRILKFKHIEKFLSFNAVDVVTTFEELGGAIRVALHHPDVKSKNRNEVVQMECFRVDQQSTDRFVSNVLSILKD